MDEQKLNSDEIFKEFGVKAFRLKCWVEDSLQAYNLDSKPIDKNSISADQAKVDLKNKQKSEMGPMGKMLPFSYHITQCLFERKDVENYIDEHNIDLSGTSDNIKTKQGELKANPYVNDAIRIAVILAIRCDRHHRKSNQLIDRNEAFELFKDIQKEIKAKEIKTTGNQKFPFEQIWKVLHDYFPDIRTKETGGIIPMK